MNKKKYDEIYFYDSCKKFERELDFVYLFYKSSIKNIFDSPEIEAQKYKKYLNNHPEEINVKDESDIPSEIQSMVYRKYILIKNMKYRNLAMYINLIYQMFEQLLISIITHQKIFIVNDRILIGKKTEKLNQCIDFFDKFNFNIRKLDGYQKLDELRLLQNVLKHGDGGSKEKLLKVRPDLFIKNNMTLLNFYHNTLIDDSLNINEKDLDDYYSCIKLILDQFPEKITHEY